jgi:hypothetical protein
MRRFLVLSGICVGGALATVTAARAAVVTNTSIPFSTTAFVPCANGGAGEVVDLSGQAHLLSTSTINDNHVSGRFQLNFQDVSGTGEITGAEYHETGVLIFESSGTAGFEQTNVVDEHFVGRGPGNDLDVHVIFHVTINPNGDLTAFVDNFTITCS